MSQLTSVRPARAKPRPLLPWSEGHDGAALGLVWTTLEDQNGGTPANSPDSFLG